MSFNTSHVVIYHIRVALRYAGKRFQYISCCYLSPFGFSQSDQYFPVSIHLMLLFIEKEMAYSKAGICFNTSHVVIYLKSIVRRSIFYSFQYISCCYLSRFKKHKNKLLSLFQYISCCYLSKRRDRI